jgi:hypothetical protein
MSSDRSGQFCGPPQSISQSVGTVYASTPSCVDWNVGYPIMLKLHLQSCFVFKSSLISVHSSLIVEKLTILWCSSPWVNEKRWMWLHILKGLGPLFKEVILAFKGLWQQNSITELDVSDLYCQPWVTYKLAEWREHKRHFVTQHLTCILFYSQ